MLAGGSARRLGGADKPAVLVGGRTLLDRVLDAVADAGRTVVVGPPRPVRRPVSWAREHPPGGGPVAALAAGLPHVRADLVALLAADLPFLDGATLTRLRTAATGDGALLVDGDGLVDGALLVDADGRDQLLAGVWRTAALRAALAGRAVDGARLVDLLAGLAAVRVSVRQAAGSPAPWFDCDTPRDVEDARALAPGGRDT